MQLEDVLRRLEGVKRSGGGYSARCPAHEDKNASLSVKQGDNGGIVLHCHAGCTPEQVVGALGLSMQDLFPDGDRPRLDRRQEHRTRQPAKPEPKEKPKREWVNGGKPVARYAYTDAQGKELAAKRRKEYWDVYPDGSKKRGKDLRWEHAIPAGVIVPPYRLPELLGADTVFLCEGEKDVDNLRAQGLAATCSPNGAGTGNKWRDTYTPYFAGKTVYILQDNDEVGKKFAQYEAEKLSPVAQEVKVLDLTALWPGLPEHGDISDVMEHLGATQALADLLELADKAPGWEPGQEPQSTAASPWFEKNRVNETAFCDAFRQKYGDMACWGGVFYDENGVVERDKLLQRITQELSPYVTTRLAQKAKDLLAALRSFCYQEAPQADPTKIHVQGGCVTAQDNSRQGVLVPSGDRPGPTEPAGETGKLRRACAGRASASAPKATAPQWVFHADRSITQNRLNVEYDPAAQPPAVFLDYVNALLEPEDVLTLQEFLGYCCIPTTKAQKMLFLIGSGGEGKSVLTQVLKGVFGTSMTSGSLHDLERNRFTLANLEGKLLFLDEDMGVSATKESQVQKRLVTANAPLSIERKGEQAVQAMLTCRLMAFGNVPFSTLYDHSEGAFRRRIILTTKPKQEGRRDDRDLPDKILQGKSGVFNWMLEGLSRLTSNGWEFTISQRARENLEETKRESFNLLGFLADENAVRLGDLSRKITGVDLYDAYTAWCYANGEKPVSRKSVTSYLKQEQQRLGIQASNHVPDSQGGKVRGFAGIEILDRRFLVRGSIRYDRPFSPVEVSQNAP